MTVFNQAARTRFTADGFTTLFHIFWPFIDGNHVTVMRKEFASTVEEILVRNVDYTIIPPTGPWPAGAFFSIPLGPKNAVGDTIAMLRAEPVRQDVNYVENDPFPAASHEGALDFLTYHAARTNERFSRALLVRDTDPIGAGGRFNAMNNRISSLSDPILGNDAATMDWVLAQISNPVGWAPDKNLAQWNADRLQGRTVQNTAPTDGYVLKWSATNGRWEPQPSVDATSLLASNNTWTGQNVFNGDTQVFNNLTMTKAVTSLVFASAGQRIKGRFYGTPHADRTLFTSNTAGQDSIIGIVPTGGITDAAGIAYYGGVDPDNASVLYIAASPGSTLIQAAHTGAGVTQPIQFAMDTTLALEILTNSKVLVNRSADVTGAQFQVNGMASRETALVSAHRNGVAFAVPNTTWTKVDFTFEEFDRMGWFDIANDRFQPTVPGDYIFWCAAGTDVGSALGTRHQIAVYKSGVLYKNVNHQQSAGGGAFAPAGGCAVFLNGSTDYAEIFVWHNAGGPNSYGGGTADCYVQITHAG